MNRILLTLFITACALFSQAQTKPMSVVSKVEKQSGKTVVKLKWFAGDFDAFKQLVSEGSTVERVEISAEQDPKTANFDGAIKTVITPTKTRLDKLDANLESTLQLQSILEPFLSVSVPPNDESKSFAFALAILDCSISKEAGEVVGCTFTDESVEKGKTYAYRVRVKNAPDGFISVQTNELTSYPKIENVTLTLDRKNTVEMRWQARNTKAFGYGFQLEKSLDSPKAGNYLTKTPYVPVRSTDEKADKDDSFRDEQLTEGKTHFYRVVGLNYFGEAVMYSEWQKIYIPNHVHAEIYIDTTYAKDQTRVIEGSAFGDGKPMNINRYELHQSTKKDADYTLVESKAYSDSVFKFTVPMRKTGDQFYYKVLAISKDNDTVASLPSYVFTLDQEPPAKPTMLTGEIDSNGVVRLSWQAPTDKDLQGYRIYRANDKREEFTERNKELSVVTTLIDTIRLDNLTSEVYYCVKAVDLNFNNSPFSDTILVLKPDTIAPVPAMLSTPVVKDSIMVLSWINSPSVDIKMNFLIREQGTIIDTLKQWSDQTISFEDNRLIAGTAYNYRIVTADKSRNASHSEPRKVYYEPGYRKAITEAKAVFNTVTKAVDLTWVLPQGEVFSFQIYKSLNGGKFYLVKTIENGSCVTYTDKDVQSGVQYAYKVKYVLQSGIHGMPTKEMKVSF
jgi:hypothetical protein